EQTFNLQIIRTDPSYRRESAVQHVIKALVVAGLFNRHQVVRFLYHEHRSLVSARARAIVAGVDVGDVIAGRTENDLLFDFVDGLDEPVGLVAMRAEDVKRESLSRLLTNARQSLELVYEFGDRFNVIEHLLYRPRAVDSIWLCETASPCRVGSNWRAFDERTGLKQVVWKSHPAKL